VTFKFQTAQPASLRGDAEGSSMWQEEVFEEEAGALGPICADVLQHSADLPAVTTPFSSGSANKQMKPKCLL
jgi:hypothetical protein